MVAVAIKYNGVAGIISALIAGDNVSALAEEISNLTFPLVAPLTSNNHNRWHMNTSKFYCQESTQHF